MWFQHKGGGKRVIGNYEIEIKPDLDPEYPSDPSALTCHAVIRSPRGEIVFEVYADGAEIEDISGTDINGDGEVDAVISGYSGGAHCCWTYYFISLGTTSHLIREIKNEASISFKSLRDSEKIEIAAHDGTFAYFEGPYAFSPIPLLILRLVGNDFRDVSSEFQNIYDDEIARLQNGLDVIKFLDSETVEKDTEGGSYPEIKQKILMITLSYLYSGRPVQAWEYLEKSWPPNDTERLQKEILSRYCTGLRGRLRLDSGSICTTAQ